MLKKIPKNLSPELVKEMMEMGHGDYLLLADANFPGHSHHANVVRADGIKITDLLDSVLQLFPLDSYSEYQVKLMEVVEGDDVQPTVWNEYKNILDKYEKEYSIEHVERFEFYEQTKSNYLVVLTGETALYGNIMLRKGVI